MATLSSSELKNLRLSENVCTKEQIQNFVDETLSGELDVLNVKKLNTSDLSVENTLNLGKDNNIYGQYSTAFGLQSNAYGTVAHSEGRGTVAGANSLRILNISYDIATKTGTLQFNYTDGIEVGDTFLMVLGKNFEDPITVTSVNPSDDSISYVYSGTDDITNFVYGTKVDDHTFNDLNGKPIDPSGNTNKVLFEKDKTASYVFVKINDEYMIKTLFDKEYEYESGEQQGVVAFLKKPSIGDVSFGDGGHAEGLSSWATGLGSHSEGRLTNATGKYAHAEGYETSAGYASHAEGFGTYASKYSHAEGYKTVANNMLCAGYYRDTLPAHAEGLQTSALNYCTNALGVKSLAKDRFSYVWNAGDPVGLDGSTNTYESHGGGTYNINPKDGISGFYIGEKNLCAILEDVKSSVATDDIIVKSIKQNNISSNNYFSLNNLNTNIGHGIDLQGKTTIGLGNNVRDYSVASYDIEEDGCILSVTYDQMIKSQSQPVPLSDSAIFKYDSETGRWERVEGSAWFTIDFNKFSNIISGDYSIADMTRLLYNSAANKNNISSNSFLDLSSGCVVRISSGIPTTADNDNPKIIIYKAKAKPQYKNHDRSFTWNGEACTYHNRNVGSFSINPVGGLDGFYVGDVSMREIIAKDINDLSGKFDDKLIPYKPFTDGRVNCSALGIGSNAFGVNCKTEGQYSIAVGNGNVVSGLGSVSDSSGAFGLTNTVISSEGSFAIGKNCQIYKGAHHSIALGMRSKIESDHRESFVWNGQAFITDTSVYYTSKDRGTFNVNPIGGANGFYVGDSSLCSLLQDAVKTTYFDNLQANNATVRKSLAVGSSVKTFGNSSIASGNKVTLSGDNSIGIGQYVNDISNSYYVDESTTEILSVTYADVSSLIDPDNPDRGYGLSARFKYDSQTGLWNKTLESPNVRVHSFEIENFKRYLNQGKNIEEIAELLQSPSLVDSPIIVIDKVCVPVSADEQNPYIIEYKPVIKQGSSRVNNTFTWNGNSKQAYSNNKEGTFAINPIGGVNGFYIGKRNATDLFPLKDAMTGQKYDLTDVNGIKLALSAVITAFGGTVVI